LSGTIYVRGSNHGGWIASVAELPGCMARGDTRDAAAGNARRAFPEYLALLKRYGVSTEHWNALDPGTFEVKDSTSEAWFDDDLRPLEEHEMRDFLHQMEGSRSALLALVGGIGPEDMERRPTPDTWSVREAVEHIMTTQLIFLARLEDWPARMASLQGAHRLLFQRFSVMEPEDTKVDHMVGGQRWSTRRVMRRVLEHEYEHMEHIKQIMGALGGQRPPE
jgi:predicted RNase H-like HicB family nuclease